MKRTPMLFLLLLTGAITVSAQTTGSIGGIVTDSSDSVLPGVTVELSGPAMPGVKVTTTQADGSYAFRNIPPGEQFTVRAQLEGFQSVSRTGIQIFVGRELALNFSLVPQIAEMITVSGDSPLVDVKNTTAGLNITTREFENLPTVRSFQRLTAMAPGVSFTDSDLNSMLGSSPSVGSSSPPENNYLIDGVSTTGLMFGVSETNVPVNFIAEVQVMTGGYSAEYGRSMGGVFNVVTKSGSNDLSGDVFGYLQKSEWASTAIRQQYRGTATEENGVDRDDAGLSIGGPIRRDRLWFFAAFDHVNQTTRQQALEAAGTLVIQPHDIAMPADIYAAKVTWRISDPQTVVGSFYSNPYLREGWLGGALSDPPVALRRFEYDRRQVSLWWNRQMRRGLFLEATAGRFDERTHVFAMTEIGRTVPLQYDVNTQQTHGGNPAITNMDGPRQMLLLKSTVVAGSHELRLGADLERRSERGRRTSHSFSYYGKRAITPSLGVRDLMVETIEDIATKGGNDHTALFVDERWRPLRNLQLNLGLRYENQKLDAGSRIHVATRFDEHGKLQFASESRIDLGDNWAPRLGLVWDPFRSGRSRLFASAGRFYEAIPMWINLAAFDGFARTINRYYAIDPVDPNGWYNPNGSPLGPNWVSFRTTYWGKEAFVLAVDPSLRTPYQDELTVGFDRQFWSTWVAGVRLLDRRIGSTIEDFNLYGDPDDPNAATDYIVGNPGQGSFGKHLMRPKRHYTAMELTLQRSFHDRWQLVASLLSARSRGNWEGLYDPTYRQLSPNLTEAYDLPAMSVNADGRLSSDVPFQLKIYGSYQWPFGLNLSEALLYSAGRPISMLESQYIDGYGLALFYMTERGSEGRTPAYWNLDLHADYPLPVPAKNLSAQLIVDIFNATNNHGVLSVDEDYTGGFYKNPWYFQAPRTIQAGIRLRY